jgi:hypothetical protein
LEIKEPLVLVFLDNVLRNHDAVHDTFVAIEQDVDFHVG